MSSQMKRTGPGSSPVCCSRLHRRCLSPHCRPPCLHWSRCFCHRPPHHGRCDVAGSVADVACSPAGSGCCPCLCPCPGPSCCPCLCPCPCLLLLQILRSHFVLVFHTVPLYFFNSLDPYAHSTIALLFSRRRWRLLVVLAVLGCGVGVGGKYDGGVCVALHVLLLTLGVDTARSRLSPLV